MPHPDLDTVNAGIDVARRILNGLLDQLTDAQVAEPSRLPDWTRGHVLAHLAGLGAGVARQLERTRDGADVVEFYDGGRAGRAAAIEAGAGVSADEHRDRVRGAVERVDASRRALTPATLARRTGYRDRPAADVVLAWWRELMIHLTDLDLGVTHADLWDASLRGHLAEFLAPRVPAGVLVEIEPWDVDEPRSIGSGEPVVINGAVNDVFAWLVGREPATGLVAERDGAPVPLPTLNPWP